MGGGRAIGPCCQWDGICSVATYSGTRDYRQYLLMVYCCSHNHIFAVRTDFGELVPQA